MGLSMGGYIAFEIVRQAPERVAKLALINTQARPDTAEATARRQGMMARAASGSRFITPPMLTAVLRPAFTVSGCASKRGLMPSRFLCVSISCFFYIYF